MTKDESGFRVLYIALALGALGDGLLRVSPLGLNAFLWIALFCASTLWLGRRSHVEHGPALRWLGVVALLFAAAIAWRDSSTIKFLAIFGIFGAFALSYLTARGNSLRDAGIWQYIAAGLASALSVLAGLPPLIASDLEFKSEEAIARKAKINAAGVGLLISVPVLAIFATLLVSADDAFRQLASNFLSVSIPDLFVHLLIIVIFAWCTAGYLRGLTTDKGPLGRLPRPPRLAQAGIIEIGLPLALLDVLFLLFVIVQFKYFFGGSNHVQSTAGLVYSEYARRGFFELVTVAALVLPLLLLSYNLLDKTDPKHERVFRVIAGAQVLLVFVIMVSAFLRMRLYQQEYGMTELRLYTVAFMVWLAAVFICFVFTVLRSRTAGFAFSSLVSAFVVGAGLVVINPDGFIVKTNAARAAAGRPFDITYNSNLSADAVPALIDALPLLAPGDRARLAARLLLQSPNSNGDWRAWSLSRHNARVAIESHITELQQLVTVVPPG
ncbi:MAG TPA: DUF4173 domain-containing protein [Blastocatellia bacterium]